MNREKTPQSWSLEQKFEMVIACASMDDSETSAYCRERGIRPHHIKQWKDQIDRTLSTYEEPDDPAEIKYLMRKKKSLERQLRRKEKALAEAAALLKLAEKAEEIWGRGGED